MEIEKPSVHIRQVPAYTARLIGMTTVKSCMRRPVSAVTRVSQSRTAPSSHEIEVDTPCHSVENFVSTISDGETQLMPASSEIAVSM